MKRIIAVWPILAFCALLNTGCASLKPTAEQVQVAEAVPGRAAHVRGWAGRAQARTILRRATWPISSNAFWAPDDGLKFRSRRHLWSRNRTQPRKDADSAPASNSH